MSTTLEHIRLVKGAIITCPNQFCNETIGRLSEDLKAGDYRVGFEKNTGQGARLDKLPHCKCCNHRWFVTDTDLARIHTGRGWFPNEAQMLDALNG